MDRSLARQLRVYRGARGRRFAGYHGKSWREKWRDAVARIYASMRSGETFINGTGAGRALSDGISGSESGLSATLAVACRS